MIGFEDLGGLITDEANAHVTLTYFDGTTDITLGEIPRQVELTIDGGDRNFASVKLTAAEAHRLRNLLAKAERRLS